MAVERLQVGIVGCGYQGGRLAEAIELGDSLTVAACADIDAEAANKLAARVGQATTHSSIDDLLENANVDVIMVATPHHELAGISLKAIQAGKHVLAEKPIGLNEREAIQIEEAVAHTGVCYMAGYSFRYLPAWHKIHELLAAGVVGEIVALIGYIGISRRSGGWMTDPACGGGPLLFVGSHLVDQILWCVADEPVEVYADVRRRQDTQADETSAFQIRFAHGATAQCCVTETANRLRNTLEIIGRAGYINMQPCGFLDYELTVESSILKEYEQRMVLHPHAAGDLRNAKHLRQLDDFVTAIRSGRQPTVDVHDGRRVLKVIDAVFASGRTGQPITLNFQH